MNEIEPKDEDTPPIGKMIGNLIHKGLCAFGLHDHRPVVIQVSYCAYCGKIHTRRIKIVD